MPWTKQTERDEPASVWNKLGDDEPIFILRAQDATAPEAVLWWCHRAERAGVDAQKIFRARVLANEMLLWQQQNPGKLKLPD